MAIRNNPLVLRAFGFALTVFALYMLLCLGSYNPADPSLNRSTSLNPSNFGGSMGATLADLTFQTLGLASWLLAAVPLAWGIKILRGEAISFWWLRFCALLASMVFAAQFFAAIKPPMSWPITAGLGGSVGLLLQQNLAFIRQMGGYFSVLLACSHHGRTRIRHAAG